MEESFVVAIDGPAGAGKSTAARLLADQLGFEFLDTGAMYRCVTLAAIRSDINVEDWEAVDRLASRLDFRVERNTARIAGENVTDAIRSLDVSAAIGKIADNPLIRKRLSQMQRDWAVGKCVVSEGRDQGSVVFEDSRCKIFLTASDSERARRRCEELAARGVTIAVEEVLAQQSLRDREDRQRVVGGLRKAPDAVLLITDGLSLIEVVQRMSEIVHSKLFTSSAEQDSSPGNNRDAKLQKQPSSEAMKTQP